MKYYLKNGYAAYDNIEAKYRFISNTNYSNNLSTYHKTNNFEESTAYYFKTFAKFREESFIRAIDKLKEIKKGKELKVLDVGSLYGLFLAAAKKEGWQVFGLEPSTKEAVYAREKYNLTIFETTIEGFESDMKYDTITFWDVFEHLPHPQEVLKKVESLMCPKGILIIRIPNANGLLHKLSFLLYRVSFGKISFPVEKLFENHSFVYTERGIKREILKHHFKVITKYKEPMIDLNIDVIINKSYMKKIPATIKYLLAFALKSILWLSKKMHKGDSLVIFCELS